MHCALAVLGRDLDRRVLPARRRAADQERQHDPSLLHLLRHKHHLVERRRDEAAQANQVGALVHGDLQNPIARDHDAEVHDLVVVAPEDHTDDVLADVVHVPLDGRHHDLAGRFGFAGRLLLRLHERLEVGDRFLHRSRALHDLRQEHLAGAEQVTHDLHAVHQRPLDDLERSGVLLAGLLDVLLDELDDAMDQGVRQPALDVGFSP